MSPRPIVAILPRDDVAVVLIDNPPVNALSHAVRLGLIDTLNALRSDPAIRAVVLACAGKTFAAGADIKEFGKPPLAPALREVIEHLDGMTKPVVAALHGTILGGGLELALGCHYRVAAPAARLGFPEVKLGLLPGGGGTQRLPRAVGATMALRMIVGGAPIAAGEALESGLIDELADGDLTEAAIGAARRLAEAGHLRRLRDDETKLAPDRQDRPRFDALAAELTKRTPAMHAPAACVKAVRAALDLPFDEGLALERALFANLVAGEQSKAQRHLFFAEREAVRIADLSPSTKPRMVERVGVIGAGTMGRGIAMAFADAGFHVALAETADEPLQSALKTIARSYQTSVARGRLAAETAESRLASIEGGIGLQTVAMADVIVEAVFEDMPLKRQVFSELDRLAGPHAILATNTSYLDVDAIAAATARPTAVAGLHFFSPANVMRLVEIVRGKATADEVLLTLVTLARRLGKIPVIVGNGHGFVGNRMLRQRNAAAERLLLAGARPEEIDAAVVAFGFPMGPLAASDLAGLDIGWRMRRARGLTAPIADALCERGRFGQEAGKGFYRYEPGSREPLPDPEVAEIIAAIAGGLSAASHRLRAGEIVERLFYPMVNEGARILQEGIAARPGDIDVVWVHGYGWPAWRGGPMFWADSVGPETICGRLEELAGEAGDETLRPAPLLRRLAAEGRGFGSPAPGRAEA